MRFRVATLNLDQDHKRWDARRHLIGEEIANLRPDILALNEVSVPLQSARGLRKSAAELTGVHYNLVQQARANSLSKIEGEALLTRFPTLVVLVEIERRYAKSHRPFSLVRAGDRPDKSNRTPMPVRLASRYATHAATTSFTAIAPITSRLLIRRDLTKVPRVQAP